MTSCAWRKSHDRPRALTAALEMGRLLHRVGLLVVRLRCLGQMRRPQQERAVFGNGGAAVPPTGCCRGRQGGGVADGDPGRGGALPVKHRGN